MADTFSVLFHFPSNPEYAFDQIERSVRDLPLLTLPHMVLFPFMAATIVLRQERAIAAVEAALAGDRTLFVVAQREQETDAHAAELFTVGVEAVVQRSLVLPDGSRSVSVQGRRRMHVVKLTPRADWLTAHVVALDADDERTLTIEALMRAARSLFERVVRLSRTLPDESYVTALNIDEPGWLADLIAATLPIDVSRRQEILETLDIEERLRRLVQLLAHELDVLELEHTIQTQAQREVERADREPFLREQLRLIQRELGEHDPYQGEMSELRNRLLVSAMPSEVRAKGLEELDRLEGMQPGAQEYTVVRTYLDWLLNLPWGVLAPDQGDFAHVARELRRHHYGLDAINDRILEFLAVRHLAGGEARAPILCLVGPPGVGKTTLGAAIAAALQRPFVRISLGGVRDEAEIRGHRRTYVSALPGRFIKAMKDAGCMNPVILLDEIDKMTTDFRGDPSSALLEVLDRAQHQAFVDHYLDVPFDLSQVLFVATANTLEPVPAPLRDRMEVLTLAGYTEAEKLHIARTFLLPNTLRGCGLNATAPVQITTPALRTIIRSYTAEAGVRNLEREIATICRKIARQVVERRAVPRRIGTDQLVRFLGKPRQRWNTAEPLAAVGVAMGLSWTAHGGDVLAVEVAVMDGKGTLLLTGQLGPVLRESAQAAVSFARTNAARFGLNAATFDQHDLHIHLPDGAVPKDGPSAGVALAVALLSALTGRAVRPTIAMTGEVTLRGRVLPVGGIKEKVLGAHRAGIATVVLPRANTADIHGAASALPPQLRFVFVDHLDQVIEQALLPVAEQRPVPHP